MAFTSPRWKPFFEDLERRGILSEIERWVRERIAVTEQEFRLLIRTTIITDGQKLADVHVLQGRLSAYANLLNLMHDLGKRPTDQTLRESAKTGTDE